MVEHLAELVAEGKLDAEYIAVESEHSAMSACLGAAAAGARTFTATASQGLLLMHEILFLVASQRLPVVMVVANRAISGPINIWCDHSDVMPQRDTGWVQIFAQSGQEVADLVIQSFRLAEDHRVLLPVMLNMDGFTLSHMIERICLPTKEQVAAFLPPIVPGRMLDPKNPRSIGTFGAQDVYTEVKRAQEAALLASEKVFAELQGDFAKAFGRSYRAVEPFHTDDAEVVVLTMGAAGETARTAVEELRADGHKVGHVGLRLWRPFPAAELKAALKGAKVVAVLDRALNPGGQGGPLALELKAAYFGEPKAPEVRDFVAGLGGRELSRRLFKELVRQAKAKAAPDQCFTFLDVRES